MRTANRLVSKCRRKKGHYIEMLSEKSPLLPEPADKRCNGVSEILNVEITLKDCEDLGAILYSKFSCITIIWEFYRGIDENMGMAR